MAVLPRQVRIRKDERSLLVQVLRVGVSSENVRAGYLARRLRSIRLCPEDLQAGIRRLRRRIPDRGRAILKPQIRRGPQLAGRTLLRKKNV